MNSQTLSLVINQLHFTTIINAMQSEIPITLGGFTGIVRSVAVESGNSGKGVYQWIVKLHNLDKSFYVKVQ